MTFSFTDVKVIVPTESLSSIVETRDGIDWKQLAKTKYGEGFSTPLAVTSRSYNVADLDGPVPAEAYFLAPNPFLTSIKQLGQTFSPGLLTMYDDYSPFVAVPDAIKTMDSRLDSCMGIVSGIYDPPQALSSAVFTSNTPASLPIRPGEQTPSSGTGAPTPWSILTPIPIPPQTSKFPVPTAAPHISPSQIAGNIAQPQQPSGNSRPSSPVQPNSPSQSFDSNPENIVQPQTPENIAENAGPPSLSPAPDSPGGTPEEGPALPPTPIQNLQPESSPQRPPPGQVWPTAINPQSGSTQTASGANQAIASWANNAFSDVASSTPNPGNGDSTPSINSPNVPQNHVVPQGSAVQPTKSAVGQPQDVWSALSAAEAPETSPGSLAPANEPGGNAQGGVTPATNPSSQDTAGSAALSESGGSQANGLPLEKGIPASNGGLAIAPGGTDGIQLTSGSTGPLNGVGKMNLDANAVPSNQPLSNAPNQGDILPNENTSEEISSDPSGLSSPIEPGAVPSNIAVATAVPTTLHAILDSKTIAIPIPTSNLAIGSNGAPLFPSNQAISAGGPPLVIGTHTMSVVSNGWLDLDGSLVNVAAAGPTPSGVERISNGNIPINNAVLASAAEAITPGALPTTIGAHAITRDANGNFIVDGTSSYSAASGLATALSADSKASAFNDGVLSAVAAVTPAAPATTFGGHVISHLSGDAYVVDGSSSFSGAAAAATALENQAKATAVANVVAGMTAGASVTTIGSHTISRAANGAFVVDATSTFDNAGALATVMGPGLDNVAFGDIVDEINAYPDITNFTSNAVPNATSTAASSVSKQSGQGDQREGLSSFQPGPTVATHSTSGPPKKSIANRIGLELRSLIFHSLLVTTVMMISF